MNASQLNERIERMENIDSEYIEDAVIDLIELFGIKNDNDIDYFGLVRLIRDGQTKDCVQKIAQILELPIEIDLSFINENSGGYRNSDDKFETSDLVKTDRIGRGTDGIAAQVEIPSNIPPLGSSRLNGYKIKVKVSANCTQQPESFIFLIFHELSHVLLAAAGSKHSHNEIYTDITPLVLGYIDIAKMGRKSVETTYGPGVLGVTTTTRTTKYGYLDDSQFTSAVKKINDIIFKFAPLKDELIEKTETFMTKHEYFQKYLALFRKNILKFTINKDVSIQTRDNETIASFFNPTFFNDLDAFKSKNEERIAKLNNYHSSFNRYSIHNVEVLKINIKNTSEFIQQVENKIKLIKEHTKILYKYLNENNKQRLNKEHTDLENDERTQKDRTSKEDHTKNQKKRKFHSPSVNLSSRIVSYGGIILIILIFIVLIANSPSSNTSPANCTLPSQGQTFVSLNNGSVIHGRQLLNGLGELEITNGTDNDAVIKIINTYTKISIREVYIRSHNQFTIRGIPDGQYNVLFSLGKNWDTPSGKFVTCKSYSKFDESFTYTTTTRQYSTYKVTLNSVVGGTATTTDLDENEFEKL